MSKRKKRGSLKEFSPNRPLTIITRHGVSVLEPSDINAEVVGWKAFGLNSIPTEWVPPFFVLASDTLTNGTSLSRVEEWIRLCAATCGLTGSVVAVRSSGSLETLEHRGGLVSATCAPSKIKSTIEQLSSSMPAQEANIHWIIEKFVEPVRKGHLSNERRVSREPRDWLVEFEPTAALPGYISPIGIRHWREGSSASSGTLNCGSAAGVTLQLRKVAFWATSLNVRVHFEWVWTGSEVWIVQADADRARAGVNPHDLRPAEVPNICVPALSVFRPVTAHDFALYRKLRNARIYNELGYTMPDFYVLDDVGEISEILQGSVSEKTRRDLAELTRRPLIIRTDGLSIPTEKREMLPRSDGLATVADAEHWLLERLRAEVLKLNLSNCGLCLIAHHFIPSSSAAWALSEPGKRIVRIESLWGVPEGLYWYGHDTFEVDTGSTDLSIDVKKYRWRKKLRFKGTYIAPDASGQWVSYHPLPPHDWQSSIEKKTWIEEIARVTKQIAQRERCAVLVMWFIDNDSRATPHGVLPWFHCKAELDTPKAAPRRKLRMSSDFTIRTNADWESIRSATLAGKKIERIMLEPTDPVIVRNQEFARELAAFAATNNIVVELAGGILSHAYYQLRRHGAQVECVDLFGTDEDKLEYNKLVRDKIPEIIKNKGESVEVITLSGEALMTALREKLVEEALEAADAKSGDELIGELADVMEVIDGICESLRIPMRQVTGEQRDKQRRRGGFKSGVMLKRTISPHSLSPKALPPNPELAIELKPEHVAIQNPSLMPRVRTYRRPDSRQFDESVEKILTFETPLTKLGSIEQSTILEISLGDDVSRSFRLTVEITRNGSVLWTQTRLRLEPSQIAMKLEAAGQMNLLFSEINES